MKKPFSTLSQIRSALAAGLIAFAAQPAFALTFTSNANIGPANTNYEGLDITVSNCTLVVDGAHTFASMHVGTGGVLTHSFSPGGAVSNIYYLTNQAQVLYGTTPVTLQNSNVITSTVTVAAFGGTTIYTNGQDYLLTSPDGIVTQLQRTTNSTIPDGGIVLVSYEGFGTFQGTVAAGLNLTISNNVTVDAGGVIFADGLGFSTGPGVGTGLGAGGGGSYGGYGGASATAAIGGALYGSFNGTPSLGSGGGSGTSGPGGVGGGLIQINAGGNVILNGLVTANGNPGTNNRSGGGSGGGISITAGTFVGSGTISANGGAGEPSDGGGGGGGRISVQYNSTAFTGSMKAYGGLGFNGGTAGTVYTKPSEQNSLLVFDNGGHQTQTNSTLSLQNSTINVIIRNGASVTPPTSIIFGTLTVATNGLLVAAPNTTMILNTSGGITVQAGGHISADSKGFAPGSGSGSGRGISDNLYRPCGGGGYGGNGAASAFNSQAIGGTAYGSELQPSGSGSGGGSLSPYSFGGSGGGSIQINAQNAIVQVDGSISANGGNGSGSGGGGGSGGTITMTGGTLLGSGSITVAGGTGANSVGGGGGGGRMLVNVTANLFTGKISAYGGGGSAWGGAGTVVLNVVDKSTQLVLDNNGNLGTNTPLQTYSTADLIIRGGAIASASSSTSFANLFVNSNGWLVPNIGQPQLPGSSITLGFGGNATIQPGGGIIADSAGSGGGTGSGAGHTTALGITNVSSGAGHGAFGGGSIGNLASGGSAYDTPTGPTQAGSGGGGGTFGTGVVGGSGGGIVRLTVTGTLEVDGLISANGGNGVGEGTGGGSGGSIWLSVGTLAGAGSISAIGGNGFDSLGGGGAGGMIFLPCNVNAFSGQIAAYGGSGANRGGTGTILIQTPGRNSQLVLDGGGNRGANTSLYNSTTTDVTLRNGAMASINESISVGNLLIGPNSSLIATNFPVLNCASLTVQAGGSILGDAQNTSGSAIGHGVQASNSPCGGGGNGGSGGNGSASQATGGINLQYTSGTQPGSAGGSFGGISFGGAGGAAVTISTTGLAQIDGLISCNGGNGSGAGGGGGSGGSLTMTCGTLAGIGTIRANGGAGVDSAGGGGGGGFITINVNPAANQFSGAITAYGGSGANWGSAGPIVFQASGQTTQYIIDAGGNPTNTSTLIAPPNLANVILRNGAVATAGALSTSFNLGSLLISSNSWLYITNSSAGATLLNCTSANIQAGGGIVADGFGYGPNLGQGAGHFSSISPNFPCGGGGHGGYGGNSISNFAAGGLPYDNQQFPGTSGSGGGGSSYSVGGAGGGVITLTVTGLLQVDGVISANGLNGIGVGGGGGAGGSIRLTGGTLAGVGAIRANGGNGGTTIGGGGSGGLIALSPNTNLFTGAITVTGGGGANRGGGGSIYLQQSGQAPQLILDNGGLAGSPTQIQPMANTINLVLRNGAVGYQTVSSETFANLTIGPNSFLISSTNAGTGLNNVNLVITGSATIQAGGGIIADLAGYPAQQGPGAGHISGNQIPFQVGGGGGHGGVGGAGGFGTTNLTTGGTVYDSVISPNSFGSGGGQSSGTGGGVGGGNIHLSVTGTLDNSGKISANGGNAAGPGAGGGAGGSISLSVGTLAGNGVITANGGNGALTNGGGGGGGRISLSYTANSYVGATAALGGGGFQFGGAGTIYTKGIKDSIGQVLVDNGGADGASTPLSTALGVPALAFPLTIQNGGMVSPQTNNNFPLLSTLTIAPGGVLTGLQGSTLDVLVFNNVIVAPGGMIAVDGEGYSEQNGPGAGQSVNGYGSGAGYGGIGGAAMGVLGGSSYGSAAQPTDFGSGGGFGSGLVLGGGSGGGALRLNVGGVLSLGGEISSEGAAGLQENAGGGAGGSVWVTAGTLAGSGLVAADGGEGELFGGGGGAGGRIALYTRVNEFAGSTSSAGGAGDFVGGNGSISISNTMIPLQVVSNTPTGVVSNGVSSAIVYFNVAPNPNMMNSTAFTLITPNGAVSNNLLTVTRLTSWSYLLNFPLQTAVGTYTLVANQSILDLYSRSLSQPYSNTFVISLPVIQGTITDTNGNPVPGVTIQNTDGFSPTTTDANGNYALGFLPGSSFIVTPSSGTLLFAPASISYTNLTASVTGQNYVAATTFTPSVKAAMTDPANLSLSWNAVPGVNYQIYCSSDLTNWVPWGGVTTGNGPTQVPVPIQNYPSMFFSVQPSQ